ncbi:nuclear transport factor 2 family protein [Levilactobacillus tongjiangensis]|uniref:Nuclear transport factor 2 family protein n=1 Tax=Levilactobacillus tongjiangensis TaxID=2486023 RepID=A0ABW1SSP9_9LACO|nr:nuclear transport factor 2 family protein [Levilactobacillus tongjiangensis]
MTNENTDLTTKIIALEKGALDKWFKGDTSGYLTIWSQKNFSHFDSYKPHRVDTYAEIKEFVLANVEGKLFADTYDFEDPRVQIKGDMAVLTYQLFAKTSLNEMHYNCIEVYEREGTDWKVVHSTWSFIRPMDMDFGQKKTLV